MPRYYPLYLDAAGRRCVVVGGGGVAQRKVEGLLEAGAEVVVISPEQTPHLQALAEQGVIQIEARAYDPVLLEDARLVIAATNRREINAQIALDARERNILANIADAPEEGDFVTASVIRRGDLCLTISTGGNHPLLAARISKELEQRFVPEYGEYVQILGEMRETIQSATPITAVRRAALALLLENESELLALLSAGESDRARSLAKRLIEESLQTGE